MVEKREAPKTTFKAQLFSPLNRLAGEVCWRMGAHFTGYYKIAIRAYERVLKANPERTDLLYRIGYMHLALTTRDEPEFHKYRRGHFQAAETALEKFLKAEGVHPLGMNAYAVAYYHANQKLDFALPQNVLRNAIEDDSLKDHPALPTLLYNRAVLLILERKFDTAIEHIKEARTLLQVYVSSSELRISLHLLYIPLLRQRATAKTPAEPKETQAARITAHEDWVLADTLQSQLLQMDGVDKVVLEKWPRNPLLVPESVSSRPIMITSS